MEYDQSLIENFYSQAMILGEKIKADSITAQSLLEALKKKTDFSALIEQRKANSENFLAESKSFSRIVRVWSNDYVKILSAYKQVISFVIMEMEKIEGLHLSYDDEHVKVTFNDKEFTFHFEENEKSQAGIFNVPSQFKEQAIKEEEKIVQEIAEILTLDKNIQKFIQHIVEINNRYEINRITTIIEQTNDFNAHDLVQNLRIIYKWWMEVKAILDNLKKSIHLAVQMDERAAKEFNSFFRAEKRERLENKHLRLAMSGTLLVGKIALNFIPGVSGVIQAITEAPEAYKLGKEAVGMIRKKD